MANIVDGNIMLEVTRLVEDDLLNLKTCGLEGKGKGSLHVALFGKVMDKNSIPRNGRDMVEDHVGHSDTTF